MGHKHKKDKKKKHHQHHRSDSSNSDKRDIYDMFSDSDDDTSKGMESEDVDAFLEELGIGDKKEKKHVEPSPLRSSQIPPPSTSDPDSDSNDSTDDKNESTKELNRTRVSELIKNMDEFIEKSPKAEEEGLKSSSSSSSSNKRKVPSSSSKPESDSSEVIAGAKSESTEEPNQTRISELIRNMDEFIKKTPLPDEERNSTNNNDKKKHKKKHKKKDKYSDDDDDDSDNSDDIYNLGGNNHSSSSSKSKHEKEKEGIEEEEEEEEEENIPIPSARKRPQSARHYQNIQPTTTTTNNNNNNINEDNEEEKPKETFSHKSSSSSSFSNPSFSGSSSQYEELPLTGNNNNNNNNLKSSNSFRSNKSSKSLKESEQVTLPENRAVILQSNPALNSELQSSSSNLQQAQQQAQQQPQPPMEQSARRPVSFHRTIVSDNNSENSVKELSSKNENLIQRAYESERTNQISSLRSMETVKPLIQTTLNDKTKWKFDIFRKTIEDKKNNNKSNNNLYMTNNNNNNNERKEVDPEEEENKLNNVYAPLKETSAKKNSYYDKISKPQIRIPPRGTVAYVHYMKSIKCTCKTKTLQMLCTIDHPCGGCARAKALYGMNIERDGCSYNPVVNHVSEYTNNDDSSNFVQRQENDIKTKRKEKMKRIGIAEYESGIIKECPVCRERQSYENYITGKNACSKCGKKYQYPKGWEDVKKEFWKRNDDFIKRKNDKRVVERDVYDYKYGVTYYCRVCKKTQSLNEYMNHQMKCPFGHPYIPQYSNYEINDDEEEEEEKIDRIDTVKS